MLIRAGHGVEASGWPAQSPPSAMLASRYMGLCMSGGVGWRFTSRPSTYQTTAFASHATA